MLRLPDIAASYCIEKSGVSTIWGSEREKEELDCRVQLRKIVCETRASEFAVMYCASIQYHFTLL